MNAEINLLIKKEKKESQEHVSGVKKLRIVSLGFLFLVAGMSVLLFIFIVSSPLPSLREKESEATNAIARYQTQFGNQLLVRKQLQNIASVLDKRSNLSNTIEVVKTLLPQDITISSLQVNASIIKLTVSAHSLVSLESFFQTVVEKAKKKEILDNVTSDGISLFPDSGTYTTALTFQ